MQMRVFHDFENFRDNLWLTICANYLHCGFYFYPVSYNFCLNWAFSELVQAGLQHCFWQVFFLLTNLVDSIDVVESSNDLDGKFWDSDESFLKDGEVFLFDVFCLGNLTIFGLFDESRSKLTSKEFGWDEAHSSMLRFSSSTIIF